jgi:Uma2 family endonuclease
MVQPLRKEEKYTYADYAAWDTEDRYELIHGIPYLMAPGPSRAHQKTVLEIGGQIGAYLKGRPCEVFIAPYDVRLNADGADDTVVQPDVLVVCDKEKSTPKGIVGAPDLVIEVLSPSTKEYDSTLKLDLYLSAGVRECWLVNTEKGRVHISSEKEGQISTVVHPWSDPVPVGVFPGFFIDMNAVAALLK